MNDHHTFGASGMTWELRHPNATIDHLGMLPLWFNAADPRPALAQADAGYQNTAGCGFHPFEGHRLVKDGDNWSLVYGAADDPEADPPMQEIARTKLRDETICLFDGEWVAIIQPDETFVVARCD